MGKRLKPHELLRQARRYAPSGCIPVMLDSLPEVTSIDKPFLSLPLGQVKSTKGDFIVDDESVGLIMAQFNEMGHDLLIDYEHQTFKGGEAPAAGWGKLLAKADGIYVDPEWTERAKTYILNKEYRYHSPAILVRMSDRKAVALFAEALTNLPAVKDANPILNSLEQILNAERTMDELIERLIYFLNLPLTSTRADVVTELEKLLVQLREADGEEQANSALIQLAEATIAHAKALDEAQAGQEGTVALSEIATLVGLDKGADFATVKGNLMALKNPTGVVLREEFDALQAKLKGKDAQEMVALALKQGKVSPAMQEWALKEATDDPEAFKVFLSVQPEVVPLSDRPGYTPPADQRGTIPSDTQLQINSMLGIDDETFKQYGPKAETGEA